MKKFLYILLSAALLLSPLTACGSKDTGSAAQQESQAMTETQSDTMHLNMLFSLIGTPDVGVTELLGDGDSQKYSADGTLTQRLYSGVVYGTNVTFSVSFDEFSDVSAIDVDFDASVSQDALSATITELTGRKPAKDGTWQAETAVVSIQQKENCMCMTLVPYQGPETNE